MHAIFPNMSTASPRGPRSEKAPAPTHHRATKTKAQPHCSNMFQPQQKSRPCLQRDLRSCDQLLRLPNPGAKKDYEHLRWAPSRHLIYHPENSPDSRVRAKTPRTNGLTAHTAETKPAHSDLRQAAVEDMVLELQDRAATSHGPEEGPFGRLCNSIQQTPRPCEVLPLCHERGKERRCQSTSPLASLGALTLSCLLQDAEPACLSTATISGGCGALRMCHESYVHARTSLQSFDDCCC